eukprot:364982-Chlamydomonas_euryale.AAC.2
MPRPVRGSTALVLQSQPGAAPASAADWLPALGGGAAPRSPGRGCCHSAARCSGKCGSHCPGGPGCCNRHIPVPACTTRKTCRDPAVGRTVRTSAGGPGQGAVAHALCAAMRTHPHVATPRHAGGARPGTHHAVQMKQQTLARCSLSRVTRARWAACVGILRRGVRRG